MKKYLLSIIMVILVCSWTQVLAGTATIKEFNENPEKYKTDIFTISGEVASIVNKFTISFMTINKNLAGQDISSTSIFLYNLNDGTGEVYIISSKNLELKEKVTFSCRHLMDSKDELDDNIMNSYDKNILANLGTYPPIIRKISLQNLINKLPKEKDWMILVEAAN